MSALFPDVITSKPTRAQRIETQTAERKRKKKLAYDATSEKWKAAVWDYAINVYLPNAAGRFIFEDLTTDYEEHAKRTGKPLTIEKRAFAHIQARLLKGGFMEVVEGVTGRSYEGNLRPMYRSLI